MIIDAFTRYTKLYPVESTKAEHALPAILQWISQFGCPSEIVSDNGTQFVNKLIEAFTQAAGIEHEPFMHIVMKKMELSKEQTKKLIDILEL